jgi:hypothetical protein
MRAAALFSALVLLATQMPAAGQDLTADTMAILHDLLLPHGKAPASGTGERAATLNAAMDALRKERLLDLRRPPVKPLGIADRLGQALGLGQRTANFLPEVAIVHDAFVHQDIPAAERAIQALYEKMGRKKPDGQALATLMAAVKKLMGSAPPETVRTEIKRPDYTITLENARAAGQARVDVVVNGPDGRPARVSFKGNVATQPDAGRRDLATRITPAAEPIVMTASEAERLKSKFAGRWRDQDGGEYEISIDGENAVVARLNPPGIVPANTHRYRGSYRLGEIVARFDVTSAADLNVSLHVALRRQIATMSFGFGLKLESDGDAGLKGTWSSQHVTHAGEPDYKVDRIHSPYAVALTLTRPQKDYRIVSLDIDYRPWEARQEQLRARLQAAEDDEKRLTGLLTDALNVIENRLRRAQQALKNQGDAKSNWEAADARFTNHALTDAAKSDAYRALERRRDRLAREVDRLYDALIEASATRNPLPPVAFEIHKERSLELDSLNANLDKMAADAGLGADRQRARQASHEAFATLIRSEGEFLAAAAVLEKARAGAEELATDLLKARAKAAEIAQELARLAASGPRIGGTWVEESRVMKYETTIWEPKELLDFLDGEIAGLGLTLKRQTESHRAYRDAYVSAQESAIILSDRLRDGIRNSAVAQGITETGFNAWDVVEKTMEAGPVGALGEGAKKVAEAWILGPPSFYEASFPTFDMESAAFSDIRSALRDVGKYADKRAVKSFVTGEAASRFSAASVIVQKYIESRSMHVYRELARQAVGDPTQAALARKALESLEKAQAGLRKAVDQGFFRTFARSGKDSFVAAFKEALKPRDGPDGTPGRRPGKLQESVYKELAKMAIKKFFAEWLEGVPLAGYMEADAYARVSTHLFRASGSMFWQMRDDYDARVTERREVLRQYDPKNSMRIIANEPFADKSTLRIILRDGEGQWLKAAGREVAVKIGGKLATPVPGETLTYGVEAQDLIHDGKGGVVLQVVVSR